MRPDEVALRNHKVMITQKFNPKHKSRLRSTVTSFHERGYTAFDYHNYPLQAYICYGTGVTKTNAAIFQDKLCLKGHIWKDTGLSSRCNHPPYNCFICTKVRHMRAVNSGEYAQKKRERYAVNSESHNAECLQRYHVNKERIKEEGKIKRRELRKLVKNGEISQFKNGNQCKHCKTTLKYTLANTCVECSRTRAQKYLNENAESLYRHNQDFINLTEEVLQSSSKKAQERRKNRLMSATNINYEKQQMMEHLEDFNYQCAYCQKNLDLQSRNKAHLDHFIALSKGGNNHLGNYVPSCRSCNLNKSDKHPYVWYKEQTFFSRERWRHILAILWKHQERYELFDKDIIQLIQFT